MRFTWTATTVSHLFRAEKSGKYALQVQGIHVVDTVTPTYYQVRIETVPDVPDTMSASTPRLYPLGCTER